jgi:hypothetical protein
VICRRELFVGGVMAVRKECEFFRGIWMALSCGIVQVSVPVHSEDLDVLFWFQWYHAESSHDRT